MAVRNYYDAVVVGSGPNGLSAAIRLAQEGLAVLVLEARATIGGGTRTAELTLPGFRHDICSAVHPLTVASPFLSALPLEQYGLEWVHPQAPLAHGLAPGKSVLLERSVEETAAGLGADEWAYRRLMAPLVKNWDILKDPLLGPLTIPRHPVALAFFGLQALLPAKQLYEWRFKEEAARALLAGISAHAVLPLEQSPSAAFGLVLGMIGHAAGWPFPRGGATRISQAMAAYLQALGGQIETGVRVTDIEELPAARAYLFDITPRQLVKIAGRRLPERFNRSLRRFRYGPGIFKVDYALDGPIPWADPQTARAATVHLGGTLAEIAASERAIVRGEHARRPYTLVIQHSLFDDSRAPAGKHTAWAYCHVPSGSTFDMEERISGQIERFAPGFKDRILARHVFTPKDLEEYNPNFIGGDINAGKQDLWQLFTRPTVRWSPYTTPARDIYICSSSTPPGGGVHGMCGYFAAQAALKRAFLQ